MKKLFDDEWRDDLSEFNIISIEDLSKEILGKGKDSFEGIRTNKTFDEISNKYALRTPFGKKSAFYKPTTEDYDALSEDFYTGGINYELLAEHLKGKLGLIEAFLFNPEIYFLGDKTIYSGSSTFNTPVYSTIKNNNPFVYKKAEKEVQATFDLAKLNTRKNLLSNSYTFGIYFDNYKVIYNLNFIYKDGEDKKFQDTETKQTSDPTDFKLNDEYVAIKLFTSNVDTFVEFLRIVKGYSNAESMKKSITRYYLDFFATAKGNPDIIDGLYENIPDFVLETLTDETLWKDFVSLSEKSINTSGTNENISIINLLKGVKNPNWWYNQINKNPDPIRKIFEKFSNKYIEELITSFSRIGLKNWTNKELEQAWKFDLDYEEYRTPNQQNDSYIKYTGFAYYLEKEKKYKIGTALFLFDQYNIGTDEKEIGNEIKLPFAPMKTVLENGKELYIPCFVAEYFTNKKIDEEFWQILNNIASGLLPEVGAGIARGAAILSRILSGRKIKTVEELIVFLEKVDQNVMAEDLEKVGIQVLFRGTTKSINGEIFIGNLNSIEYGASTSTDPIRAIIFGIESSSKPGTKGVLQVYLPKNLKGLNLSPPNYRVAKELEVIVNTSPENLSNFVVKEILIEDARKLINEMYGLDIPKTITSNSIPSSNMLLEETIKLTPKEAQEFYTKVIKLKK
ncbi:hypothetical protein [Chryseobacterium polytrichastri]|uniref:Uncharacterized protein n=1 Tax=Chryseobacterium polytrichastri TaxID=1302687 RepID=A0A1M6RIW0_9FLAO|nr:hypothetical protein [Chryseobacterium polytrichastri]SHK32364.1 hypothetical protein SAMN05444267_10038 [Chryseobacterium polytrichastri]